MNINELKDHACSGDGCLTCRDIENRKAGIREVVEALPKGLFIGDLPPLEGKPYSHLGCYILEWNKTDEPTVGLYRLSDDVQWQAKLKEWGL